MPASWKRFLKAKDLLFAALGGTGKKTILGFGYAGKLKSYLAAKLYFSFALGGATKKSNKRSRPLGLALVRYKRVLGYRHLACRWQAYRSLECGKNVLQNESTVYFFFTRKRSSKKKRR